MDTWTLYALTVLPNLKDLVVVFAVLGIPFSVLALFAMWIGEIDPKYWKAAIFGLSLGVLSAVCAALIPNEKQMALILAGKYLTNSEFSKVPDDVAIALRKILKKFVED